jgi:hypothetical protein
MGTTVAAFGLSSWKFAEADLLRLIRAAEV